MALQEATPQAVPTEFSPAGSTIAAGRSVARTVGDALIPLSLVAAVSLAPAVGHDPLHGGGRMVFTALVALTFLAGLLQRLSSACLGLALVATVAAFALPWQLNWWPLPGVVGVGVYLAGQRLLAQRFPGQRMRLAVPPMQPPERPRRWVGRFTRIEVLAVLCLSGLASAALVVFHHMTPPALQVGADLINKLPSWSVIVAGLGFVTINAAVEEILFRGVILAHLTPAIGTWPAMALQAAGFGLLNLHGYPYGAIGVALTAVYGVLLGLLRLKSGGLLACWLAHIAADSVIFVFILEAATRTR